MKDQAENEKAQSILTGWSKAESDIWNWHSLWQAIADFFDINRATFITKRYHRGERRTGHLFDSTGLKASAELAAIIHSIVTNPGQRWFDMTFGSNFMMDEAAREWLQDCVERMFRALNDSNFETEITACYRDFPNYGSAELEMQPAGLVDGRFSGVRFRSLFLSEVAVELDAENRLIAYYRKHELSLRQAKLKWPEGNFPEELENDDDKHAQSSQGKRKEYTFIEYVNQRDGNEYQPGTVAEAAERPFSKTIVCKEHPAIIMETGLYRMPFYLFTWNRAPGEKYGRGPGSEALPDMRTLNEVVRMDLEATAMQIRPPMKTRYNNVVGDVRLVPGGITVCRDPAGLMPFDMGANPSVSKLRIEDLRNSVRSIYLLDKLALPPREQVGEMTAYEVQRRVQEMNQILGPILARLNQQLLEPMITDLFYMMLRDGGFADPPESVLNNETEIRVSFQNPLSRAQKAEEVAAIQRWMGDLMALANAGKPEALDLINDDSMARGLADTYGVPEKYITRMDEVQKVRQQRAEMQQAQQQAAIESQMADAEHKRMSGADQGGRPRGS